MQAAEPMRKMQGAAHMRTAAVLAELDAWGHRWSALCSKMVELRLIMGDSLRFTADAAQRDPSRGPSCWRWKPAKGRRRFGPKAKMCNN